MKSVLIILLVLITTIITPPTFAVNRVLNLDGDGDYVEITDSESLNSINSQVTMEAWIKVTALPNLWPSIIYKGDEPAPDSSNTSYTLCLRNPGSPILLTSVPSNQELMYLFSPKGLIALNTWCHVAGITDGKTGVMKILINGSEVANGSFGKDIRCSSLPLRIGWTHEEGDCAFAGQIDEVRIWNIARSQEDIRATMHTTLSGTEPGLVGYWRFDDVNNIATDSSPNHADGKMIGDSHCVDAELPTPSQFVIPTVFSGMITDESGQPIPDASVWLEQDDSEIAQAKTNASGSYQIILSHPVRGLYALAATSGDKGNWQFNIQLREGERRTINLTLKEAISIEGTLLMLDDATPHVAVPVQAIRDGKVIATTLSDERGKYKLINLKSGQYQLRCQVLGGYIYYSEGETPLQIQPLPNKIETLNATFLQVKRGKTVMGN